MVKRTLEIQTIDLTDSELEDMIVVINKSQRGVIINIEEKKVQEWRLKSQEQEKN